MARASGPRSLSSVSPGLASGSVDMFGWVSAVLRGDVGTRLWGLLRGWVHGLWKIVTVDVGARP